jgi:N-glycosylase/DNA lyase
VIEKRLSEFSRVWQEAKDKRLFEELVFCLLTPQSRAKTCWRAVERLSRGKLLNKNSLEREITPCLSGVRFANNKARYIQLARGLFSKNGKPAVRKKLAPLLKEGAPCAREWLVRNVKGFGLKEASHFLRNIGFGQEIAILDRHILKNMVKLGIMENIPGSLSSKIYLEIEEKLKVFSQKTGIPLAHLDLLFWSAETGEIFK